MNAYCRESPVFLSRITSVGANVQLVNVAVALGTGAEHTTTQNSTKPTENQFQVLVGRHRVEFAA